MSNPVAAAPRVLELFYNGAPFRVQTAVITASSSGNTQAVAGTTGFIIVVLSNRIMANGTVNVKWQSGTTDICGLAYLIANTGYVDPFSSAGWFETASGQDLNINLSGNVAVGGVLRYVKVTG